VLKFLQRQHERTGRSYRRLLAGYALPRSRVLRWQANVRRGQPPICRPGPAKKPLANRAALNRQIANLHHRTYRSGGAPALRRAWQDYIARVDFDRLVAAYRRRQRQQAREEVRHLAWTSLATVWGMDEAEHAGCRWNLVCDLGSRFRFDLLLAPDLPAEAIAAQLLALFRRYGPPLVLKRDNGSNLSNAVVDRCLRDFGVIGLNSPRHWPRYNGAVEYAQWEVKTVADIMTGHAGLAHAEALALAPALINARPRPCLRGATAAALFLPASPRLVTTYTMAYRKEQMHWIQDRARSIVHNMAVDDCQTPAAVWRQATEEWMLDAGLVAFAEPRNVSPLSP